MRPFEGKRIVLWAQHRQELNTVERALQRLGSQVQFVTELEDLRAAAATGQASLLVARLDYDTCHAVRPFCDWLAGVEERPNLLVVVDRWDVALYLDALRRGAFDALALPLDEAELIRIGARALEMRPLRAAV